MYLPLQQVNGKSEHSRIAGEHTKKAYFHGMVHGLEPNRMSLASTQTDLASSAVFEEKVDQEEKHAAAWLNLTNILAATAACVFTLARAAFFSDAITHGDEGSYRASALQLWEHRFVGPFDADHLRTFVYPYFLAIISGISGSGVVSMRITHAAVSMVGYVSSSFWLCRSLSPIFGERAVRRMFLIFLGNIFVLLYMDQLLTEALSIVLTLATCACLSSLAQATSRQHKIALSAPLGLMLGLALELRPGNLVLLAPFFAGVLIIAWRWNGRPMQKALLIFSFLATFSAPLCYQALHNWQRFQIVTPLIQHSLGQAQLNWGKSMIRYVTLVENGVAKSRPYSNPWYRQEDDARWPRFWIWYLEYPAAAVKTLSWRLATIFDHDRPTPYAESDFPWYRYPVSVVNMALNACAAVGLFITTRSHDKKKRATALFFIGMLLPFLALHLFIAYETRMGLPMTSLLSVFAPLGFAHLKHKIWSPWVVSGLLLYIVTDQTLLWYLAKLH